jgi:ABC-type Na+ efflux pump permease subunit
MKKVWLVASREFMAAVANKGFVIGLLLMPAIFAAIFTMMPRLMNTQGEQIRGDVRVIDPTGQILEGLRVSLTPEAITRRRLESTKRVLENAPGAVRAVAGDSTNTAMARAMGAAPALTLIERPATADVQREKSWLTGSVSRRHTHRHSSSSPECREAGRRRRGVRHLRHLRAREHRRAH